MGEGILVLQGERGGFIAPLRKLVNFVLKYLFLIMPQ